MNLALLRRPAIERTADEKTLTVVGKPAAILPWPTRPAGAPPQESVTAELRTKRMSDRSVDEERFEATIPVGSRSPHAIFAALADAFAGIEDLQWSVGADDHVILELRIRA